MTVQILRGDCRDMLRKVESGRVQCIITSPPYFGQRDYGVAGQIGLEATPAEFVAEIVAVLREARRALADDGVAWINIGDSYNNRTRIRTSSHKPVVAGDRKSWAESARDGEVRMTTRADGLKEKDLFGIPWKVAKALRADGWWLRQEIIWHKPVAKLDVARDRPSTTHEHMFLLSKSKVYHFDADALPDYARGSVWTVPATGYQGHGAAFPPKLVEPCILAGCPVGRIVLDPFGGAGTTGVVADRLGRHAVLIELKPEYADIAHRRIIGDAPLLEAAQ
jgi:DNA modification methylase